MSAWRPDEGERECSSGLRTERKHWMQSGETLWLEQGGGYYQSGEKWSESQGYDEYTKNNM